MLKPNWGKRDLLVKVLIATLRLLLRSLHSTAGLSVCALLLARLRLLISLLLLLALLTRLTLLTLLTGLSGGVELGVDLIEGLGEHLALHLGEG